MVRGKKLLCNTENYKTYFKSFQGFQNDSNWYSRLNRVIEVEIDAAYQNFLAQPVINGENIEWYAKFKNTAKRFTELTDEERLNYETVKNNTINHYHQVIAALKSSNKNHEADYLEKAIKFIDDRFLYCYDDEVVVGVWGMQLRNNVIEPSGVAFNQVFVKETPEPTMEVDKPVENVEVESDPDPEPILEKYKVRFITGSNGNLEGNSELNKTDGDYIYDDEIPNVVINKNYEFLGWDKEPKGRQVTEDITFEAQYKKIPWYKRLWAWFSGIGSWFSGLFGGFTGGGCLRWFLWLLLLVLFIVLFSWLFRNCSGISGGNEGGSTNVSPIPDNIEDKPWVKTNPNAGAEGIYSPGNPYGTAPSTPPEYREVLPPTQGKLPPVDRSQIIRQPGQPVIMGNRLNILMENNGKSIKDLAKAFKEAYPEDIYKVVYYDDVVKRMQIEIPSEERNVLKAEIPGKFSPEFEVFVFDETLFQGSYEPNDPAFHDTNKSWYLQSIKAPNAWDITRGSEKITIAIVDNGFNLNHPELKDKVVMPYNVWTHSKEVFSQEVDHGTHVAGTALAIMDNNTGLCGIAPNAAFMPIQVANNQDIVTVTSVLDGILYALYQGADVINLSMGMQMEGTLPVNIQEDLIENHFKEEERLWRKIMDISKKHDAILVIAAGNNNMLAGIDPINRPENFITVSAVDKNLQQLKKAKFSNYGSHTTISAPGVDIYSTVKNNEYDFMSGTSMAAPIVSGAVALMKSMNKNLTADEIICVLQGTGKVTQGQIGNFLQLDEALKQIKENKLEDCDIKTVSTPSFGDVQILLSWQNTNDLDLICVDPHGDFVWYDNKTVPSGGSLEIDMNAEIKSGNPIEHIYWPHGTAPNGEYNVYVSYFEQHESNLLQTPYKLKIKYSDKTEQFTGVMKQVGDKKHLVSFVLGNTNTTEDLQKPATDDNRVHELKSERERLLKQIERIDKELEQINNFKKNNKK